LNKDVFFCTSSAIALEIKKPINERYFDDEGVATYNKKIVNKGKLETYLYNLATAKKVMRSYLIEDSYLHGGLQHQ